MLRAHGVRLAEDMLPVERWALACPALPSCGLALTEAERVRDDIVAAIAARLRRWGLEHERLSIRITGCPNGCARPYTGDIGIVGRVPGFYRSMSAAISRAPGSTRRSPNGSLHGIAEVLDPLFALYASSRVRAAKALAISVTASACRRCSPPSPSNRRVPPEKDDPHPPNPAGWVPPLPWCGRRPFHDLDRLVRCRIKICWR